MAKKLATKQRKTTSRQTARPVRAALHSWLTSSDEAVIASLRSISRSQAAEIVKQAGIVSASGELNPILR